jgi:threonine aldolase
MTQSTQQRRKVSWHRDDSFAQVLKEMSDYCVGNDAQPEYYGKGEFLQRFEREVADLLGKEAAVFMPGGVMCQQIALRIWADAAHCANIAYHPTTHLEVNEHRAYSQVQGLRGIPIGEKNNAMLAADLAACAEPVATLLVELPLRNIGGILPPWNELIELVELARRRRIKLHLDGARLWESGPFYKKQYKEISDLFDSVYVSFYKGLGGMAGAMLAGPSDFIAQARIWQRRMGGNLITMHPYVVSAKIGFDTRLGKMTEYHERAVSLAAALSEIPAITLKPSIPHTNMFQLFLNTDGEAMKTAQNEIAEQDGIELCRAIFAADVPGWSYTEIVVGDNALALSNEELVPLYRKLVSLTQSKHRQ